MPRLKVKDAQGNVLPAQILANGGGRFTIQAKGLVPDTTYTVVVMPDRGSSRVTGNFGLVVEYGRSAEPVDAFTAGQLGPNATSVDDTLYIGRNQLFEFLLFVAPAPGSGVLMQVLNASGQVVFSLLADASDITSGAAVFLTPGAYHVRLTIQVPAGHRVPSLRYSLGCESASHGIGPALNDPTLKPVYAVPNQPGLFAYPDGTVRSKPFLLVNGKN
jgi:hypothetical protein